MNADDCRLLCEKMGRCWHKPDGPYAVGSHRKGGGIIIQKCRKCNAVMSTTEQAYKQNPAFTTVQEREEVMQWAFKQEWWEGVYLFAWYRYHEEQHTSGRHSTLHDYIKWLFQTPAHLPELVLAYGREVLGWEPKGGQDG